MRRCINAAYVYISAESASVVRRVWRRCGTSSWLNSKRQRCVILSLWGNICHMSDGGERMFVHGRFIMVWCGVAWCVDSHQDSNGRERRPQATSQHRPRGNSSPCRVCLLVCLCSCLGCMVSVIGCFTKMCSYGCRSSISSTIARMSWSELWQTSRKRRSIWRRPWIYSEMLTHTRYNIHKGQK